MALFGADWRLAKAGWLYPTERLQNFWRATGLTAILLLVNVTLQSLLGYILLVFVLHGTLQGATTPQSDDYANVLQSGILVIFPAGLVTLFLGMWLAKFGLPNRHGKLALSWPKLGWLGWFITVLGFAILMFIVLNVIFYASGVDPETYTTSSAGGTLAPQAVLHGLTAEKYSPRYNHRGLSGG